MKKAIKNSLALVAGFVILGAVTSCKKDDKSLPAIDGYNNSDEVAASNLKAHWTFDGNNNEVISNTGPANTYGTVGFTSGQLGQALSLNKGALVFPPIANINSADALPNYTVTMWIKAKNTGFFETYFGIFPTDNTDFWGNISLGAEASRHALTSDTLELKTNYVSKKSDGSIDSQDNIATINTGSDAPDGGTGSYFLGADEWALYAVRWNSSNHRLELMVNGVSKGAYTTRGTAGAMVMRTPAQAVFGSFATQAIGFTTAPVSPDWSGLATATIDDVRVFNSALSDVNITALYNLGIVGR